MRVKEDSLPAHKEGEKDERLSSTGEAEKLQSSPALSPVRDKEDCSEVCRVCQCVESDKRGEAALEFLGISPPSNGMSQKLTAKSLVAESHTTVLPNDVGHSGKKRDGITDYVEYVSPDGEIFICSRDLESGSCLCHHDALIELGCLCKNDLALAHYACALRWFISHGSIICEICGNLAENVRFADLNKVMAALKECETLRSRTAAGEVTPSYAQSHADVDPDAVAAVRRQRLIEIQSWFNPHSQTTTASHGPVDQASNGPSDDIISNVNPTTKWAVEGTGILVATGLLTVTLAWLIAPRVGKLGLTYMWDHEELQCITTAIYVQENSKEWSSYSAWRPLRSHSCGSFALWSATKDQIWTSSLLGNLVCVLVPGFWHLGFKDERCTIFLILL